MRLTEKLKDKKGVYYNLIESDLVNGYQAVDKLGQLEDIEEELGIDLYTLFKILKRGQLICKFIPMYDRKKTILVSRKINSLYYDGCYYRLEIDEDGDDGYIIQYDPYIKDYGITWALTREELDHDK